MTSKFFVFLLIIFCFILENAIGQVYGNAPAAGTAAENNPYANLHQKWTPMMQKLFQEVKNDKEYVNYDIGETTGSPYINETYLPGKVYYGNEPLGEFYYRHNAFNDEIELKRTLLKEESFKALIKDEKVKLVADGKEIRFLKFTDDQQKIDYAYLMLIQTGAKYNLYKRNYIKFTEGKPAANSMVNAIPNRFTDYVSYYCQKTGEDEIIEIPLNTSKFLKFFSNEDTKALKNYIKSNNLDLKINLPQVLAFIDNLK